MSAAFARGRRPVVLIDGRSGAGKTTLGRALAARLDAQFVSLDDCCPGWDGLARAAAAVPAMIAGPAPGYRRHDWAAARLAEWVPLSPVTPLVIEGAGALTPASARLATLRVWVDADEAVRRAAAEARDGDVSAWWRGWAAQEQAHIRDDDPVGLSDLIVGSASLGPALRAG